jgi:hypothetical protein
VPAQDQKLARVDRDPLGRQQRQPRGVFGRIERGLDHGLLGPGAQEILAAARPQDQLQRVDENGLARPRLARQDVQSRDEGDRQRVDHRHVLDAELTQHAGYLPPGATSGEP